MAEKGKMYEPTDYDRDFVKRAVKSGATMQKIAECLNIHDDTLRKHYRYEIALSRQELINAAVGVLDDSLVDGSLDAAKFVLVRVAGWREKQDVNHVSEDGSMTPRDHSTAVLDALKAKHGPVTE